MSDEVWIVIPNWEQFQHYKDRHPTWIKLYTDLQHRVDWHRLTCSERGVLVTIWMEYALSNGQITTHSIREAVGRSFRERSLESLTDAGFIELSASKPLSLRYQVASPEKRREEEEKRGPLSTGKKAVDNPSLMDVTTIRHVCPMPHCGIEKRTREQLEEHMENVHGKVTA